MYIWPYLHRLAGCYENLSGGQTGDALVDFTGGVNEVIDIHADGYQTDEVKQQELFERLYQGHDHHKALISCSISVRGVCLYLHVIIILCIYAI